MGEIKDYSEDKTIYGFIYKGLKESLTVKKSKREASFEMLRIISMMMVVVLHYLNKGEILSNRLEFWILEALAIVAVNVFVLISGYFMINSKFSLYKVIGILCQTIFYSATGAVIAVIVGIYSFDDLKCLNNLLFFGFPSINGHYWFITAYILMYLFSPILIKAVKTFDEKQLKLTILVLLIPFCFAKSVSPIQYGIDDKGYSFVWFIILFLIAGYIRLYGIKLLENKFVAIMTYLGSAFMVIVTRYGLCIFASQHEGYDYLPDVAINYNFVFVLTGSIGIFYFFKNWKMKDGIVASAVLKISPYVLGVYLLHEHLTVRYLWPQWFRVSEPYGLLRIVHLILTVIIIFTLGVIVDVIRSGLFFVIKKLMIVCLNIYFAKQEVWDYLVFGFLATIVNWVAYIVCAYCLLIPFLGNDDILLKNVSNIVAWVAAVVFAYWTNRNFVFKSKINDFKGIMKEFWSFIGARVFSFVVETGLFWIAITMHISDIIAKLAISVIVIILNYIFSKLFIFKKKD